MRLIDADALRDLMEQICWDIVEMRAVQKTIDEQPTIDPVKRGKWRAESVKHGWNAYDGFGRHIYCCSECRNYSQEDFPYCHWCGAQMERGEE